MMEKKEKITLSIDAQLWNLAKHHCIDEKMEYSTFVEQLLKEKLNKKK